MNPIETKPKEVWSSFWIDKQTQDELQEELAEEQKKSNSNDSFDVGIIRMSSSRRAISNFVNILTNKDIPVIFKNNDVNMTDGNTIYLSADISKLEDFDPAVGLALHEGSHILLTDFGLIKTLWGRLSDLYKIGKTLGIGKEKVKKFTHLMVNYVEDRYIDDYIYSSAPGYRPYYLSLYDKYFYNDEITKALKSDLMREPTLASYEARILNLVNPNTDLDALPGLREIAEIISLKNINRLKSTKDRIKIAIDITKLIFSKIKCCTEQEIIKQKITSPGDETQTVPFDIRIENEDDILGGYDVGSETENLENSDNSDNDKSSGNKKDTGLDQNSIGKETSSTIKKIQNAIEKQKQFLNDHSTCNKKAISATQKLYLDIVENSGITFVPVRIEDSNSKVLDIECVVVKNMTLKLMESGLFPLSQAAKMSSKGLTPIDAVQKAVSRGISLGTKLGKKLQIRQEINVTKFTRRTCGKIDRRLLSDIGAGLESVFYHLKYDKYNVLNLHISVDASSSMSHGSKWTETITTVVAICKAASMVENLRVAVSFRSTIIQAEKIGNRSLPYVVLAYDSAKDKFSKIRRLFPCLNPYGETPEGLAFDAIMKNLVSKKPGETYYFLNLSDGEPCFTYRNVTTGDIFSYSTSNGGEHTRRQYNKIISSGVKGVSYFIKSEYAGRNDSKKCFKRMYGKDAKFINVNDVVHISRTMNDLFLSKE